MKQNFYLPIFFVLFGLVGFAQSPLSPLPAVNALLTCSSDEMMASKPELSLLQQQLDEAIFAKTKTAQKAQALPYVLPVVVHIIHNNGSENIPDAQVLTAIAHLNQAFAHEGYYAAQGDGANTQIQFCLAKRDPNGNATNGITRTVSSLTNLVKETEDQVLKDLVRWDPTQYVNVWVVASITSQSTGPGVAGYAYLASAHGQPYDGLVCEVEFFGVDPAKDAVFIHEIGHYLNLYHTFQGGCLNDNCLANGDRVCDTPPDQATHTSCTYNSCSTDADDTSANNPFSTDVDDATENFMDYSPFQCYRNFTNGQGERMRFAIEQIRHSLLASEGCNDPCTSLVVANFTPSATSVLAGETVVFTNQTTNALSYEWYVNGNLVATTTDLSYQFTGVGNFVVELRAYNADPNCLGIAETNVTVACDVTASFTVNATELEVGEPLVCTNNSTGATGYLWTINGVDIGSSTDLNYIFANPGYYSLILQAIGQYCNDQSSQDLTIISDSPCPDSVTGFYYKLNSASPNTYLTFEDMLPNGDFYLNAYFPWNSNAIIKIDGTDQSVLWQKRIEVPVNGISAYATADEGVIGHYIWNNVNEHRICKLDSDGNMQWVRKTIGAQDTWVRAYKNGAVIFNDDSQPWHFRMAILDGNGNVVVNKAYDNDISLEIQNISMTADSAGFLVVGSGGWTTDLAAFVLKFDTLGNLLFACGYNDGPVQGQSFEFWDVKPTADGGFIAVGRKTVSSPLDNDFMIMKADANGDVSWARKIGMDDPVNVIEVGYNVFVKPNGGGYLGRYTQHLPTKTCWYSFKEDGTLEFMKWADLDSPYNYFDMIENNGEFFVSFMDSASTAHLFVSEFDPITGPKMGCTHVVDFPAVTTDYPTLIATPLSLPPIQSPIAISDATFTVLPIEHSIEKVTTCTAPSYACPEVCDNEKDDDKDGYVDCFDSDCQCFDGTDCDFVGNASTPVTGKIAWQTPTNWVNAGAIPMVANLDPQNGNIPEIIVQEGDPGGSSGFGVAVDNLLIFQGDGSNASNPDVLNFPTKISNRISTYAIGDVNADGIPELAISTQTGSIRVFSNFTKGSPQPMSLFAIGSQTMWPHGHLAFADFDQDGTPELYSGSFVYQFNLSNPTAPQLTLKLSGAGHAGFNNVGSTGPLAYDILSVTDCNGDPDCEGLELIAGAYIYSIDLDPLDGDGLQIKVARNLNNMSNLGPFQDGYNYVADLDLDGVPEIVTAGHHGPNNKNGFYVWNKNGLVAKFENPSPSFGDPQFISLAIANVFDDKTAGFQQDYPEIIYPSTTKIASFNLQKALASPSTPYWWSANSYDGSRAAGPSCFDFNSDGFAEIVYRDEQNMRIMYGGALPLPAGVDSDRNWMKFECKSPTLDDYPVVADIDGDEEAEIVVTGYIAPYNTDQTDNRGRLLAFESDSLPWPPARALWNQYNYIGVNINDDLTVPQIQQTHHLEWPQLGSGHRPWNICHTQWPIWDNGFTASFPVPDATLAIDSTACEGDSIHLWLSLCNDGSKEIPIGFPLAFYENDPRQPGSQLRGTYTTNMPLPVDSCLVLSLKIPAVLNAPLFAIANDDGTHPLPYAMLDFPLTDQQECDFDNNFDHYTIFNTNPSLDLGPDRSLCSSSVTELNAGAGFASYRWQDGSTDSTFTAYGPGTYWVEAWNECGSHVSDTISILLNQAAAIDLGNDREICLGETTQLNISGFPNVVWSPGIGLSCNDCPTPVASPSISTTYYVTASLGDCFASDSLRIIVKEKPLLSLTAQDGDCTQPASISTTAVGQGPFGYSWSSGQTTSSISPSSSGTYVVSVISTNGCVAVDSANVIISNSFVNSISTQPISCNGSPGSATISTAGGTAPYSYQWSNGGDMASITVTVPGTIGVTVTDATGCTSMASAMVGLSGQLQLGVTVSPISCHEGMDGTATVMPIFGTPPFAWQWQDGQTSSTITNLGSGNYSVTITDAIGCTDDLSFSMASPPDLILAPSASSVSCFGENDGSATVSASGGTPGYEYFWSNFQTTATASSLNGGMYTVTVTDENGCQDSVTMLVQEPPLLTTYVEAEAPFICPDETTTVLAVANGGTPPLAYSWMNGMTDSLLTDVGAGSYFVVVTDANNCTATASTLVQGLVPPTLTLDSIVAASSPTAADGAIFLDFAGGSPPFEFHWSNGSTSQNLMGVPPGEYVLTLTYGEGCEQVYTFTIDFLNAAAQISGTGWKATLYPNPTELGGKAQLHILTNKPQTIDYQLFDTTGKWIQQERLQVQANGYTQPLSPPTVAGVYWILLKTEAGIQYLKWVVL